MIRFKVLVRPELVAEGKMYAVNADRMTAPLATDTFKLLSMLAVPTKILVVHDEATKTMIVEAVDRLPTAELVDDDG